MCSWDPLTIRVNSVLNVKAIVADFNQEKALVGAFSVIIQLFGLGLLVERDGGGHEGRHQQPQREDGPQGRGGGLQRPPVAKYT